VLDPPDREAADQPEDDEERDAREIRVLVSEIDGDAERAAGERRQNPDPQAADGGREEHGRNIRREENVGAHMREAPAGGRRKREAQRRKSAAEKQRGLRYALPAAAEIVKPVLHAPYQPDQPIQIKAGAGKSTRFPALRKASLEVIGNIGSNMTAKDKIRDEWKGKRHGTA